MISAGKKPIVTINLTPLVDVSLVLVVIFMATAPMFLQSGILIFPGEKKTSQADAGQGASQDTLMIRLDHGKIWLDGVETQATALPDALRRWLQTSSQKRVVILPGDEVFHGEVIHILDLAKQNGAKKLVIMGDAPNSSSK